MLKSHVLVRTHVILTTIPQAVVTNSPCIWMKHIEDTDQPILRTIYHFTNTCKRKRATVQEYTILKLTITCYHQLSYGWTKIDVKSKSTMINGLDILKQLWQTWWGFLRVFEIKNILLYKKENPSNRSWVWNVKNIVSTNHILNGITEAFRLS